MIAALLGRQKARETGGETADEHAVSRIVFAQDSYCLLSRLAFVRGWTRFAGLCVVLANEFPMFPPFGVSCQATEIPYLFLYEAPSQSCARG